MRSTLPIQLSSDDLVISSQGLTKDYGAHVALRDVALQVPAGAVYLLAGANGAGKSTLIKVLLDLVAPTAGHASVFGRDPHRDGPQIRARVGYVPESPSWGYDWIRVGDLLQYHATYYPSWDVRYANYLTQRFTLALDQHVRTLSKGQARRVHLTMALAHRPELLVLDEPTDGLDPKVRDDLLEILASHLAESPTTVMISTHHVEEIDRLVDHIGVLHRGTLTLQSSREALRRDLKTYELEVPEGWVPTEPLPDTLLRQGAGQRFMRWMVWGREADVVQQFSRAHAVVRTVMPVSFAEVALALLSS